MTMSIGRGRRFIARENTLNTRNDSKSNDFDGKFAKVNPVGKSSKDAWRCDFVAIFGERSGCLREIAIEKALRNFRIVGDQCQYRRRRASLIFHSREKYQSAAEAIRH